MKWIGFIVLAVLVIDCLIYNYRQWRETRYGIKFRTEFWETVSGRRKR